MKKLTLKERMRCVDHLVSGDVPNNAEWSLFQISKGKGYMGTSERELTELIVRLYTLVHPSGTCGNPHEKWEAKNRELLKQIDNPQGE